MIYKDWLTEWLADYIKPRTKKRTYKKYVKQIENHIAPSLGGYELEELSARVLQKFTAGLTERGLAANTVNGIVSVLKSSIKRAAMLGVTEVQCTDAIVRPQAHEKNTECFGKDEQYKIEQYIAESGDYKLAGILLCLYTGLRIGELLALTWHDIDLVKGVITVSKTCYDEWRNGKYVKIIDSPKTGNSCRTVPIPKPLIPKLKELKKKTQSIYVVCGKTEYGAEVRSYQRTFERLLEKTGISRRGFHALRHTFATRALEVGMDVKTLSEILGHGDPTVTLKRYAHSLFEHKAEMMNRVGKLLYIYKN